jgi:hypothetical protein
MSVGQMIEMARKEGGRAAALVLVVRKYPDTLERLEKVAAGRRSVYKTKNPDAKRVWGTRRYLGRRISGGFTGALEVRMRAERQSWN